MNHSLRIKTKIMNKPFLKQCVITLIVISSVLSCKKENNILDKKFNADDRSSLTNNKIHPNSVITIGVSIEYYSELNGGTIFVSWTGSSYYWNVTVAGVSFYNVGGNSIILQKHISGATIFATVESVDKTQQGSNSIYISPDGNPQPTNLHNPLPDFNNMDITSDLSGCTMNLTWSSNSSEIAYFYLELRNPNPTGSDGEWHNIVLAQCYSNANNISLHINRYYYNDPTIKARLVIQNVAYPNDIANTPPPLPNPAGGSAFNLCFSLPSTSYHFSGTINEFSRAINVYSYYNWPY